jgi:molybdopterin-guanine dinucleotide biosynthesis protein A
MTTAPAMEKEKPEQEDLYNHITGVILAGGLSKRYGQNKAFLELHGARLIDRIAAEMKTIFRNVVIVTNRKADYEYLEVPVVEDLIRGLGPLGGIFTGLMTISDQAGFFVACDIPFFSKQLVRYMVDIKDNHAAVVPSGATGLEPLYAIYAQSCLDPIRSLISEKRYQVRLFFERVPVRYVTLNEISRFIAPGKAFLNINTPDEFARIQSLLREQNKKRV